MEIADPDTMLGMARKLSDEIAALEVEYLDHAILVKGESAKLQTVENILREQVNLAKTGEGITAKALYTNESQRATALLALKAENKSWSIAVVDLARAERQQSQCRIEIDRLHREYQLAKLAYEALAIGRRL